MDCRYAHIAMSDTRAACRSVLDRGRGTELLFFVEGLPPLASDGSGARRERKPVSGAVAGRVEDAIKRPRHRDRHFTSRSRMDRGTLRRGCGRRRVGLPSAAWEHVVTSVVFSAGDLRELVSALRVGGAPRQSRRSFDSNVWPHEDSADRPAVLSRRIVERTLTALEDEPHGDRRHDVRVTQLST